MNYKKLSHDSMERQRKLVDNTIGDFQSSNVLKEILTEVIITHEVKTPQFCLRPNMTGRASN